MTITTIGNELQAARQRRNLTQRRLAVEAGIGRATLAGLEAGRGTVAALVTVLTVLRHRFCNQPSETALGPWMAARRKEAGLSQDVLVDNAGVSKAAIVKVERGRGHVSTLLAMMRALGLPSTICANEDSALAAVLPPRILQGDCRVHMAELVSEGVQFDALITDPPYHLSALPRRTGRKPSAAGPEGDVASSPYEASKTGFLGEAWDGGGVAFQRTLWRAAFDILKPGAHLVAFGGTRTFHRLAVAIEDAGFEIRDTIMWVYSSGFPKSHNLNGELRGRGTALKPAYEPIIIARKPMRGLSVAQNALKYGTGALNIDSCRVPLADEQEVRLPDGAFPDHLRRAEIEAERYRRNWYRRQSVHASSLSMSGALGAVDLLPYQSSGRWPANIVHDGSEPVLADFRRRTKGIIRKKRGLQQDLVGPSADEQDPHLDHLSPSRFFYSPKASAADKGAGNSHPTVKPNELMRYLVRLVTPPRGTIFDPFAGSGSTGVAAVQEGFGFVGSEISPDFCAISRKRMAAALPANA